MDLIEKEQCPDTDKRFVLSLALLLSLSSLLLLLLCVVTIVVFAAVVILYCLSDDVLHCCHLDITSTLSLGKQEHMKTLPVTFVAHLVVERECIALTVNLTCATNVGR